MTAYRISSQFHWISPKSYRLFPEYFEFPQSTKFTPIFVFPTANSRIFPTFNELPLILMIFTQTTRHFLNSLNFPKTGQIFLEINFLLVKITKFSRQLLFFSFYFCDFTSKHTEFSLNTLSLPKIYQIFPKIDFSPWKLLNFAAIYWMLTDLT